MARGSIRRVVGQFEILQCPLTGVIPKARVFTRRVEGSPTAQRHEQYSFAARENPVRPEDAVASDPPRH
jgi:hypothetical protein